MGTSNITYRIREIALSDNDRVRDIILSVMEDYGCIGEGYSSSDPEVQSMYEAYNSPRSAFFVVSDERDVIYGCGGIGELSGGDQSTCELKKMYFLTELRGQGFGQTMIDTCLKAALARGYKQCYLETLEAMKEANHLYRKNGFQRLQTNLGQTGHSSCDAYFVKQL